MYVIRRRKWFVALLLTLVTVVVVRRLVYSIAISEATADRYIPNMPFESTTLHAANHSLGLNVAIGSLTEKKIKRCSQTERLNTMRKTCSKLGRPFGQISERFKASRIHVDDEKKIMYCGIPKVASTAWKKALVMSKGYSEEEVTQIKVQPPFGISKYGFRTLSAYNKSEIKQKLDTYYKFLVVRHPFDRLISTWQDKLIESDGHLRYLNTRILSKYKQDRPKFVKKQDSKMNTLPYFVEFVRYHASSRITDEHLSIYDVRCDPCSVAYNGIVKLESIMEDSMMIFNKLGLTSEKLPIYHSNQNKRALLDHFVKRLPEMEGIRPEDLEFLMKTYGVDMDLFGYSWSQDTLNATCGTDTNSCC